MNNNKIFSYLLLFVLSMSLGNAWAKDRHYCIAADEIEWDYAPSFPINLMTGQAFTIDQMLFVNDGIG